MSDVVDLNYHGDVLRIVVKLCITDGILGFSRRREKETAARKIVTCGHFLNMPHLQERA